MDRLPKTSVCMEGRRYLLLVVAILALALAFEQNLLLAIGVMLAATALVSWRTGAKMLDRVSAARTSPRSVQAGQPFSVAVRLSNRHGRLASWAVYVEDGLASEEPPHDLATRTRVFFPRVAAGGSQVEVYRTRVARRGLYRLGPLKVSTRFPFGLFRRTVTFDVPDRLVVTPRLGRLVPGWTVRHEAAALGHRHRRLHGPGRVTGEFFGVREWRSGDSRRWIHWRSSARHGDLVVRVFDRPRNRHLALLVDLWQPEQPHSDDADRVEQIVSFAATIVADACRRGNVHLSLGMAGSEAAWVAGPTSLPLRDRAMERLALVRASRDGALSELIRQAQRRIKPDSEVVLITTRRIGGMESELGLDPASRDGRSLLRRLRTISAAEDEISQYFELP